MQDPIAEPDHAQTKGFAGFMLYGGCAAPGFTENLYSFSENS